MNGRLAQAKTIRRVIATGATVARDRRPDACNRPVDTRLAVGPREILAPSPFLAVHQIFMSDSNNGEMLDQISDLQSAILGAPPEVTVPAGIFILWILIRLLRDLPHSSHVFVLVRLGSF